MQLTKDQKHRLQAKIISDIVLDEVCEIDSKFVNPIFGTVEDMLDWCSRWNLSYEFLRYTGVKRLGNIITWVRFTHKETIFTDDLKIIHDDKRLDESKILIICPDIHL